MNYSNYSNYHTHTNLCDGKDSLEDLVVKAIALGCPELGFSGHGYTSYDESYCMSLAQQEEYFREIKRLQGVYGDKIKILAGIEQDFYGEKPPAGLDYIIGSVHAIFKDGEYLYIDLSEEDFCSNALKHYHGDFLAFAEDYYKVVGEVYAKTHCDIVGHFDLITKFNEGDRLFDTKDPRYVKAALDAVDKIIESAGGQGRRVPVFEINTGAMARGYRSEPYPAEFIRKKLAARGVSVILSSDCHDKEQLLFGFSDWNRWAIESVEHGKTARRLNPLFV